MILVAVDQVIDRLKQLGYSAEESDYETLEFELHKTIMYVMNFCNITVIPDILDSRIIDRVCAYFLYYKKNSGTLSGFDYDIPIKTLKEGDTQIQYAVGQGEDTPENRFDSLVKSLERGFDKWLTPHRRIRW